MSNGKAMQTPTVKAKSCPLVQQLLAAGVMPKKQKRPSGVCECCGQAYFALTRGFVALADADMYEMLQAMGSWWATTNGYAATKMGGKNVFMHRVIMDATDTAMQVDHKNNDRCDNRKPNLRVCSHRRNMWNVAGTTNKYGYKGVGYHAKQDRYRAQIQVKGKKLCGPNRKTAKEAARDYDKLAVQHFGRFAKTNVMLRLLRPRSPRSDFALGLPAQGEMSPGTIGAE